MENKKIIHRCRHCQSELINNGKVCPTCNKHQKWYGDFLNLSSVTSLVMVILAIVQLVLATSERSKAEEAFKKAEEVKNENIKVKTAVDVSKIEIDRAKEEILKIGNAVIIIAEVIPRSTGFGRGLNDSDRLLLEKNIKLIKEYSTKH